VRPAHARAARPQQVPAYSCDVKGLEGGAHRSRPRARAVAFGCPNSVTPALPRRQLESRVPRAQEVSSPYCGAGMDLAPAVRGRDAAQACQSGGNGTLMELGDDFALRLSGSPHSFYPLLGSSYGFTGNVRRFFWSRSLSHRT